MTRLAAALIVAATAAQADDRCIDARALPGAQESQRCSFAAAVDDWTCDIVVLAPTDDALRFCFWNSPNSAGGPHRFEIDGEEINVSILVTGGDEYLRIDLPGAIATNLDGVPLEAIRAADGQEINGLLWRGMM